MFAFGKLLATAPPVSMTHDVAELLVERPPKDRQVALALAEEQFIYCSDIVLQGTESIEALAVGLVGGSAWFFWWD